MSDELLFGLPASAYVKSTDVVDVIQSGLHKAATGVKLVDFSSANLRLSLTTATPVTTADVTAALVLYANAYGGRHIGVCNASSVWGRLPISSELSLKSTDTAQTGSTTDTSTTVTALTSTAQFVRGMEVTGSGIPGSTTIATIPSSTSITLSAAATATATGVALTFKLPASKLYWVYAVNVSGVPALRLGNVWTGATTSADTVAYLNGVLVNTAAINAADSNTIPLYSGRVVGLIRTTATAGQLEDSAAKRLVINVNHQKQRRLFVAPAYGNGDSLTSYAFASTVFAPINAGTGDVASFLVPEAGLAYEAAATYVVTPAAGRTFAGGIGFDSTTDCLVAVVSTVNDEVVKGTAHWRATPARGYHTLSMNGVNSGAGDATVIADIARTGAVADPYVTHMVGWVMG